MTQLGAAAIITTTAVARQIRALILPDPRHGTAIVYPSYLRNAGWRPKERRNKRKSKFSIDRNNRCNKHQCFQLSDRRLNIEPYITATLARIDARVTCAHRFADLNFKVCTCHK